jgi:hypothetical protein
LTHGYKKSSKKGSEKAQEKTRFERARQGDAQANNENCSQH